MIIDLQGVPCKTYRVWVCSEVTNINSKSLPIEKHLNGLTFTFMFHHACGKMGNIATTTKKIEKVGKW